MPGEGEKLLAFKCQQDSIEVNSSDGQPAPFQKGHASLYRFYASGHHMVKDHPPRPESICAGARATVAAFSAASVHREDAMAEII
jgi:hypothetical protein